MSCILVVHQRSEIRLTLSLVLSGQGYEVLEAIDLNEARNLLCSHNINLVIIDIDECMHAPIAKNMWAFIEETKDNNADIPFVAITHWQDPTLIQQASQYGVSDFIVKPWKNIQITQSISQQLQQAQQRHKYQQLHDYFLTHESDYYAWKSHGMQKIYRQINSLNIKLPFYVISGSQSTGKKTLARYIHESAQRARELFISLDCATFSDDDKAEAWLAPKKFIGNGTLLLKNIEQLSGALQEKLVAYLLKQKRNDKSQGCMVLLCNEKLSEVAKLTGNTKTNSSVSTNDKYLLPELYKLLKINEIHLPPLNQRKEDIVPFIQFMLAKRASQLTLSDDAKRALEEHDWPLNLKELILTVDHLIALGTSTVTASDLKLNRLNSGNKNISLPMMTLKEAEIALLKQALQITENNIPKAAELLGLTKSSMYRRVEKYALVQK